MEKNRLIKFRGKDADTGQWRYGAYFKHQLYEICPVQFDGETKEDKTPEYIHYIILDGSADWNMEKPILKSNVIAETVGQFIGLKDKNGKEIYEGDIFKFDDKTLGDGYGRVVWNEFSACYGIEGINYSWLINQFEMSDAIRCEIIGNIYDNPELLRSEANE